MFERDVDCPTAVASDDDEGVEAAIRWCAEQLEDGDTLTVWTRVKSDLENNRQLERLVNRDPVVVHLTGRGAGSVRGKGPVLMAWADMDDIGKLMKHGGRHIRALCVIPLSQGAIRPWVSAVQPTMLGDGSEWKNATPEPAPLVVEAMKGISSMVNHSNPISAGIDKDIVVGALLALHDAGIPMDGNAIQGWALANGWTGKNPTMLAGYVRDINAGKRPRFRPRLRPDYIDTLRRAAVSE